MADYSLHSDRESQPRRGGFSGGGSDPSSKRTDERLLQNIEYRDSEPAVDARLVLDPSNAFEAVIIKMVETHRRKAKDYAGGGHPNANFYGTARQLALTGGHAVEALLATKAERLRVMLPQFWRREGYQPANEGIYDTLEDRAVYAVIACTIWNEDGYESDEPHQKAVGG